MSESTVPSKDTLVSAVKWILSLPEEAFTGYVPPNEKRPHRGTGKRGDKIGTAP